MEIRNKYPYPVQHLELEGKCNIAYMDVGQGDQTILFVHGLANYAPVFKRNIAVLKDNYRCIAIDLPGNGLSDRNDHAFSMIFFADVIKAFVDAMGLKKVVLAGHSMGGQVVMTTLLKYPEIADRMLLFAPAGLEAFSTLDKTMYYTTLHFFDHLSSEENSLRHTVQTSFYRLPPLAAEMIEELVSILKKDNLRYYKKMTEACIKSMLEEPVIHFLKDIKADTMIFFGKQDALIPNKLLHHKTTQQIGEAGVNGLQKASLKMYDNCGHFCAVGKSRGSQCGY